MLFFKKKFSKIC